MRLMLVSLSAIAGLFALGSVAQAQAPAAHPANPAPAPITPQTHAAAIPGGKVANGYIPGTAAKPSAAGWYYRHATNCLSYDPSTGANGYLGQVYLYVYTQEGDTWVAGVLGHQNLLEPQCSLGNWVAFYWTGNGWNQIYTYDYK